MQEWKQHSGILRHSELVSNATVLRAVQLYNYNLLKFPKMPECYFSERMIFRKSTLFDFFNGLWEYNGLTELAACKSFLSYDSAAGWQDYLFYFPVAL